MKKIKRILYVLLAVVISASPLAMTARAAPSELEFGNVGSALVERDGGVYVMNLEDSSQVEFYFDKARLGKPVVLPVLREDGTPYKDQTVTPLIVEPDCKIYFPTFVYYEGEGPEGSVGHFWISHYGVLGNGKVELWGSAELWFGSNELAANEYINNPGIATTFEAGNVHYWMMIGDRSSDFSPAPGSAPAPTPDVNPGPVAGDGVPAQTEGIKPAASSNSGAQSYSLWSKPVKSYLYENGTGLTRVEYIKDKVVVEEYSEDFKLLSSRSIDPELPIFGGFFAGETYNFLFYGQDNTEQDNGKEVIRVVQYDKQWRRLGDVGLFGANTIHPFEAGSLRCDEYGGYLYVRTCHEMYASSDGLNHQANVTFCVRERDLKITDAFYNVMNIDVGYVSHSFNQFILVAQDGTIVAADHGDAYPRSIVLMTYPQKAGGERFVPNGLQSKTRTANLISFPGQIGQNATGASLGGLAETNSGYVAAFNYSKDGGSGKRNVFLAYVDKGLTALDLTGIGASGGAQTPQLAPTGLEGGYLLWCDGDGLHYAPYDAQGSVGQTQAAKGALSDCAPIRWRGGVAWYVTSSRENGGAPVFYTLDQNGVAAHPATSPAASDQAPSTSNQAPAASGTAYASTQTVEVDGKAVTFACYALKDASGNQTNYIKLRDLAMHLNGTNAQFAVGWDGAVSITARTPYTANGTELATPFSGNRAYRKADAVTSINGQRAELAAFVLQDDRGNGYTYYQLRDLARALNFNVGWSAERGVFVETGKPYDPSN